MVTSMELHLSDNILCSLGHLSASKTETGVEIGLMTYITCIYLY